MVDAELELALREDHPARDLAAQLRLGEGASAPGSSAPGSATATVARAEVPRTADDLARRALAHVHLAELELVGVRVLARLEHLADEEALEVAVAAGDPAPNDPADLAAREHERARSSSTGRSKSTYSRSQLTGTS